ncbi:hypothetical protein GGR56DRAFT_650455 [Xylariaceae sp. FL0804]|nr:hypothetical protein GGR56DRAFT_650455 [Xylariaceae sp. FL0804]
MGETLREKASKKLKGPDANPSQLGDPVSLEAETSDRRPAESEQGAAQARLGESESSLSSSSSSPSPSSSGGSGSGSKSSNKSKSNDKGPGPGKIGAGEGKEETLREKAVKKLHGDDANPTQLGDPVSLEAETSATRPAVSEEGAASSRDSKL